LAAALASTGCATVVSGNERALYFSAGDGVQRQSVGSGWHWHWPWNSYTAYDLRWTSHKEAIHIHSKDGLHMDIKLAVVIRPNADELFELDRDVGPNYYDGLVRPAVFAATRDATAKFDHMEIATRTHEVEGAIQAALRVHLHGQHLEVEEVAIQHFELPQYVEDAVNKKASMGQFLAAREVDLKLAQSDAEIDRAKRRGAVESAGLEKKLQSEQELGQAKVELAIARAKAEAQRAEVTTEVEAQRLRAEGEAHAIRELAAANREKLQAESQPLTPNYVRLKALEALSAAVSGPNSHVYVLPIGKNGLPAYFTPFLNPFGKELAGLPGPGAGKDDKKED
jgi:regulator of protease activity HflC (stomatin/prohibitin superfamily)